MSLQKLKVNLERIKSDAEESLGLVDALLNPVVDPPPEPPPVDPPVEPPVNPPVGDRLPTIGPHNIPEFDAFPTIKSITDGTWHDPATWNLKRIPDAEDIVQTHHNVSVTEDAICKDIGVRSGHFTMESVRFKAQTFLEHEGGEVTITGCRCISRDKAIERDKDPEQFGNGWIFLGKHNFAGLERIRHLSVSENELWKETTSMTVPGHDWQVGDKLIIPQTRQIVAQKDIKWVKESEIVKITSIAGDVIAFESINNDADPGLEFNHIMVDDDGDLELAKTVRVSNITVFDSFRSENPLGTRGHFMATMMAESTIDNTGFFDLGRTEATKIHNTLFNEDGSVRRHGDNQIARYPFHTHHLMTTFSFTNNVILHSKKWGTSIHNTNDSEYTGNVIFDVDGAGLMTEDGTEQRNNIDNNWVCQVNGGNQIDKNGGVTRRRDPDSNERIVDTGADGSAYWFRGPGNNITNNFAYAFRGYAYNFNGYYRPRKITLRGPDGSDITAASTIDDKVYVAPERFENNVGVSGKGGIWFTWSQAPSGVKNFYSGAVMKNNEFAAIFHDGVHSFHDAPPVFDGLIGINDPEISKLSEGSPGHPKTRVNVGMNLDDSSYENFGITLLNSKIKGFNHDIRCPLRTNGASGNPIIFENLELSAYLGIVIQPAKIGDPQRSIIMKNITFTPLNVKPEDTRSDYPTTPTKIWMWPNLLVKKGEPRLGYFPTAVVTLDGERLFHMDDPNACEDFRREPGIIGKVCD